jgi:hypothetical protein
MMWPGIPPRLGLPLLVFYGVCYAWLMAELHPHSAEVWWIVIGALLLLALVFAAIQSPRNAELSEALERGSEPDEAVAAQVDRVAQRLDDHPRRTTWSSAYLLLVIALPGLPAAVHRGDLLFVVPCAGLLLHAIVTTVLLRRRQRQVTTWLVARPRERDWRSVPPS